MYIAELHPSLAKPWEVMRVLCHSLPDQTSCGKFFFIKQAGSCKSALMWSGHTCNHTGFKKLAPNRKIIFRTALYYFAILLPKERSMLLESLHLLTLAEIGPAIVSFAPKYCVHCVYVTLRGRKSVFHTNAIQVQYQEKPYSATWMDGVRLHCFCASFSLTCQ